MNRLKLLSRIWSRSKKSLIKVFEKTSVQLPPSKDSLQKSTYDLIGPADKISNLRSYKYYVPENESKIEYDYRVLREEINDWNHQYWTEQNLKFVDAKQKYREMYDSHKKIAEKIAALNNEKNHKITSIEDLNMENNESLQLNDFYREFLNENYYAHCEYNSKWISYNFQLLWPATKVFFYRMGKRFQMKKLKNHDYNNQGSVKK